MKEIKFRYRFDRGENFEKVIIGAGKRISTEIVTLEELENGEFIEYYSNYKILSRDRYTGLKDKNGKEIYEGDTVKYMDFDMGIEGDGDEYVNSGEIKYDEESAMFFITNRNMADIEEIWLDDILEVIGNIHENSNP